MKKAFKLILSFGLAIVIIIGYNSCKKEETSCPVPETPKTVEQLLTAKTWKADEIRIQQSNNTTQYYKRGSVGTTYDSDSLKFAANNTGTYYYSGSAFPITWNLTDAAKTKMTVVINQPPTPITIYIENMNITDTYFKYSQYYNGSGLNYMASCTRTPN
ncbi:MAG: hypothetical protein AAB221_12300 [Bacteroidota bacterium]